MHGITALLAAIWEGHTAAVEYLLSAVGLGCGPGTQLMDEQGADKSLKAPDGASYASCAEKDEIKKLLQ